MSFLKCKKSVTQAKKCLVLIKTIKIVFELYHKVRYHGHYTGKFREAAHSICNLRYKTRKEVPIVFHSGYTYDYHFIINQLAKEFDDQLECLGEITERYIKFSVPIEKSLIIIKQLRKD